MPDQHPFFSVTVLAWQVEAYLEACLLSVQAQTYTDFEAILVMPPSSDGTEAICRRFAAQDARFTVCETQNRGQLLNRLSGFSKSRGEYLLCLDGDDLWKPELLQTLYDALSQSAADVLIFGHECFSDDRLLRVVTDVFPDRSVFRGDEKKAVYRKHIQGAAINEVCCKVFRKSLLARMGVDWTPYETIRFSEDLLFTCYLADAAQSIQYLSAPLYRYRIRPDSIVHTFREGELREHYLVREAVRSFLPRWDMDTPDNRALFYGSLARYTADWIFRCAVSELPFQKKQVLYRWLKNEAPFFPEIAASLEASVPTKRHRLFVRLFFENEKLLERYAKTYRRFRSLFGQHENR